MPWSVLFFYHYKLQEGKTVSLKDFKGKYVAIYFYNKDDTPVVTKGGAAFAKVFPEFQKLGIPLIFIGPDRWGRIRSDFLHLT